MDTDRLSTSFFLEEKRKNLETFSLREGGQEVKHLKLSREYVINGGRKRERWQRRRGGRNDRFSGALTDDNPRVNIINRNECNRAGQQPSRGEGSLDPATKPRRLTATTTHRRRLFECELRIATNANFKHPDVPTFSSTRSSLLTSRLRAFVHESKAFEPSLSGNCYSFKLRKTKGATFG